MRQSTDGIRRDAELRLRHLQTSVGQELPRDHRFRQWQSRLSVTGGLQHGARIIPVRAAATAVLGNENVSDAELLDLVPASVRLEQTRGAVAEQLSLLAHVKP